MAFRAGDGRDVGRELKELSTDRADRAGEGGMDVLGDEPIEEERESSWLTRLLQVVALSRRVEGVIVVLSSCSEDDLDGESMWSHFLSLAEDLDCHCLSLPDFLVSPGCSSEVGSRLILWRVWY